MRIPVEVELSDKAVAFLKKARREVFSESDDQYYQPHATLFALGLVHDRGRSVFHLTKLGEQIADHYLSLPF